MASEVLNLKFGICNLPWRFAYLRFAQNLKSQIPYYRIIYPTFDI
jgi:hypothetical protein